MSFPTTRIWLIKNNVLITTNFGEDNKETPLITFAEYLQDLSQMVNKKTFIELTKFMIIEDKDDLLKMPKHMKLHYFKVIKDFRDNFDEWKQTDKYAFPIP